jgi:hypothetical protein
MLLRTLAAALAVIFTVTRRGPGFFYARSSVMGIVAWRLNP